MCQQKTKEAESNETLYKRFAQKQQQLSEVFLDYMTATQQTSNLRAGLPDAYIKILGRIVGGTAVLKGEFNECCLVGRRNLNGTIEWFCTGVLVHPRLVLTAAHCVRSGDALIVALGTNNQNVLGEAEVRTSRKVQSHPAYTPNGRINDIAAIVLQEPSGYAPVASANTREISTTIDLELVGFGNDDVLGTKGFGIKRKVLVDMVSIRQNPQEDLNQEESEYGFESDLEFVAGGKGFDTCSGDSGGPVYINTSQGRALAGLTSRPTAHFKSPCGEGGIYTRVDVHTDFINSFVPHL